MHLFMHHSYFYDTHILELESLKEEQMNYHTN